MVPDRPEMTVRRIRLSCWISKARIQTRSHADQVPVFWEFGSKLDTL